jgi:hypothetical protein
VLQEVTVVGSDLDHATSSIQLEPLNHHFRVFPGVFHPRISEGGKVRILREDLLRRNKFVELN